MLESGDYCIVSYFKDFKNIYLCKAIKNVENAYVMHNMDVIMQTSQSNGQFSFFYCKYIAFKYINYQCF